MATHTSAAEPEAAPQPPLPVTPAPVGAAASSIVITGRVDRRRVCGRGLAFADVIINPAHTTPLPEPKDVVSIVVELPGCVLVGAAPEAPLRQFVKLGSVIRAEVVFRADGCGVASKWQVLETITGRGYQSTTGSFNNRTATQEVPVCRRWIGNTCPHLLGVDDPEPPAADDDTSVSTPSTAGNVRCSFRHHFQDADEEARFKHLQESYTVRSSITSEERKGYLAEHEEQDKDSAPKAARVSMFAKWLVDMFGADFLSQGAGVIDVAGGKGLVSIALMTSHAARRCTVVDPQQRPSTTSRKHRRALNKTGDPTGFQFIPALFNEEFATNPKTADLVRTASILIGLHPDQATEPIVDVALKHGKPFAVVPCCVFPSLFPHRRTPSGQPVRSINEFVEYLCAKAPSGTISVGYLPFKGRCKVVYAGAPPQPHAASLPSLMQMPATPTDVEAPIATLDHSDE